MIQAEPIFTVRHARDGVLVGTVQGRERLEQLLRQRFVEDGSPRSAAAMSAALGVDVAEVASVDLDDATWARLVWETCRDGGTWWEDEQTSLRISAIATQSEPEAGAGSGLSLVDVELPTERPLRAIATCGALDTVRIIDGRVDTWSTIRDLVSDARTRHAQAQVKMHHERYERLRADFELARETRARAVRDALATKVPQERLQAILGVKRAQVYKIAGTTTPTGTAKPSKATGSRPASG